MLRKLTKRVTNNFGLKVLGAVFAIILWLVIVNVEDPDRPVVFTIPVKIEHADYLTNLGKTYEIVDGTDVITFTVTGKRSIVEKLSESDFSAVANMENIDETMTKVPIIITAYNYSNQLEITKRSSYVQVVVENIVEKDFDIKVVTSGALEDGCYIASTKINPEKVTVKGPESAVNQIAEAMVVMDVNGHTTDMATTEPILFVDADGNEVPRDHLEIQYETANVALDIAMRKTIPVKFTVTGSVPDQYRLDEVNSSVEKITLEGEYIVLNAIDELEITPAELNVDGHTSDFVAIIHLTDYLPEGVKLVKDQPEDAEIALKIEAQTSQTFDMPVENITVTGLGEGLELTYAGNTVTVTVTGYEEELASIAASQLTGTLDASSLQKGAYTVAVKMTGDHADYAQATAAIVIKETKNTEE